MTALPQQAPNHIYDNDNEDDPRCSSCALCIRMKQQDALFRPEFTHQLFTGEWIPGHIPRHGIPPNVTHKSHANHVLASKSLEITIQLSPSCQSCRVDIQQEAIRRASQDTSTSEGVAATPIAEPTAKRPKLDSNKGNEIIKQVRFVEPTKNDDDTTITTESCMSRDEILQRLQKALPPIVHDDDNGDVVANDYLTAPIGTVLDTYTRKQKDGPPLEFCTSLATGNNEAATYHAKVQNLAYWWIENASSVDLASDQDGGSWKVLYLFQKHSTRNQYSLAGYMTLFYFSSPFKKPRPGTVVRICQALLLPQYQRMGHGKILFRTLYDKVTAIDDADIVEINVEDPAEGFCQLRNKVDYERLKASLQQQQAQQTTTTPWLPAKYWKDVAVNSDLFFQPLSEADAIEVGAVARITPKQVQIAYELLRLDALPADAMANEATMKRFRLLVKKRLLKWHQEDLGACDTKEERQAMLAKLFNHVYDGYKAILKRT